jgi:hypothetical protein
MVVGGGAGGGARCGRVQSALDLATANFALDRDELTSLATALRTSVGLEADDT